MRGLALLALIALFPLTALGGDPMVPVEKRLYLASGAGNVLQEIIPLLPFTPDNRQACYIATAAMGADWAQYEIDTVRNAGFQVKLTDLATLSEATVTAAFQDCEIIFVGGGHTLYLLQEFRRSGFDKLVTRKIAEGIPYVGTSAGSIVLAPDIECVKFADQPEQAPELTSFKGLNLFPLVPFVHFDHPDFKAHYREIMAFALDNDVPFLTLNENQFIFVEGDRWRIVEAETKP